MDLKGTRFSSLPTPIRHAIFAGLVVCLAGLFYMYVLKNRIDTCKTLNADIAKLEDSIEKLTEIKSRAEEFRKKLAEDTKYLAELRKMLPAQKETPEVLRNVQEMAVSSNLKILKFAPRPTIDRDFYSDWPIQIEVQGNYNGLGTFFEKIGRSTRIIDVGSISIQEIAGSTDPKLTLKANCTATTFVYKEPPPDVSDTKASDN